MYVKKPQGKHENAIMGHSVDQGDLRYSPASKEVLCLFYMKSEQDKIREADLCNLFQCTKRTGEYKLQCNTESVCGV